MIGIICAMEPELRRLLEETQGRRERTLSGYTYIAGTLAGQAVVLAQCGIGKVNAAVCAQTMILNYQLRLLINSGVAGSLQPPLSIGDICVAEDLVQHDVDTGALGDPPGFVSTVNRIGFPCAAWAVEGMIEAAKRLGDIRAVRGRIASGDQFIARAEDKARIVREFDACACEMEGGSIAQVCWINAMDCAVIRAISDSSDGMHAMEYSEFLPMAANNSARLVLGFLEKLA